MYLSQVEVCVCEEVRVVGGDKPHHWLIALGSLVHTDGKVWLLHDQVQPLSLWRLDITQNSTHGIYHKATNLCARFIYVN